MNRAEIENDHDLRTGKDRRLRLLTLAIVLIDLLAVYSFAYLSLTWRSTAQLSNANVFGSMTHSLIVDGSGRLYVAWIEQTLDKSMIMFASSTDFGSKWRSVVAYETALGGIGPDELKLNNLSMITDPDEHAHITFMKNVRPSRGYGDAFPWVLLYITNKGGEWSAPEEIKGPWNTDWMGFFNASDVRGYSEGVEGLQVDMDKNRVLHVASRHEGWWNWGAALYHHFKAPDSEWKTEEIRWKRAGTGDYATIRQFYILRQLATEGLFHEFGATVNESIDHLANQKLAEYRGDPGIGPSSQCWNKMFSNVDCQIQGLPLLFVSPTNELYVVNSRYDNQYAYSQRIPDTNFWRSNQLVNSEIDSSHQLAWSAYAPVLNIRIRAAQLLKAAFDKRGSVSLAMISDDSKKIYYTHDLKDVETAYVSSGTVGDVEIAMQGGPKQQETVHMVFTENLGDSERVLHTARASGRTWSRPDVLLPPISPRYRAMDLARRGSEAPRQYKLPFLAMTFVGAEGSLYFLRIGKIPAIMMLRALQRIMLYFALASVIMLSIFIAFEISLSRRRQLSRRMAFAYLSTLIIFLLVKDVYSWFQRDVLFLQPDLHTILATVAGFLSVLVGLTTSYGRIVNYMKRTGQFLAE
jgi:hypothetical protein